MRFILRTFSSRWSSASYSTNPTQRQTEMMARGLPKQMHLDGVKDIVVVASGKGGVGKSTTSVNLAVMLAQMGKRVGLLDGDVFGPSIPLMMNLNDTPLVDENNLMIPLQNYGVKCISMGFLIDPNKPIIWRGPLVMSALQRLLRGVSWKPLDILIIDTPPGTGDIHLSIAQNVPVSGTILVSTPQTAALNVTKRGAEMYQTLKVPLIGLVENMSHVICTNCKEKLQIYPKNTAELANDLGVDILASLPMDSQVSHCADSGVPIVVKSTNSTHHKCYENIANKLLDFLDKHQ
ncbi:iron-sulfur protein NUBPL [Contarinia nasturtii]|uniref:iron-sulfur protein NUBPL n=1 Tax=Contarinia nasturtii TaxID=265458 RepID=UPI0012D3F01B|nr:iron-sulfur protein NUBPL [Contarinia nasturtii]